MAASLPRLSPLQQYTVTSYNLLYVKRQRFESGGQVRACLLLGGLWADAQAQACPNDACAGPTALTHPSTPHLCRPQAWTRVFDQLCFSLGLFQLTMVGILGIKRAVAPPIIVLPLLPITLVFWLSCRALFRQPQQVGAPLGGRLRLGTGRRRLFFPPAP